MGHALSLVLSETQKQKEFSELKAKCGGGTVFAWHGSPVDNWHSILRRGLTKDTKYLVHDSADSPKILL